MIWTVPRASVVNWAMFTALSNKVVPAVLTANVIAPVMVLLKLTFPNAPVPVELRTVLTNTVIASL